MISIIEITYILIGIVVFIAIILFMKLIKGALKIAIAICGLMLIFGLLFGIIAFQDISNLKKQIIENDKWFVYSEGEHVLASIQLPKEGGLSIGKTKVEKNLITDKQLSENNSLILWFTEKSFQEIKTINFLDEELTIKEFAKIMRNNDPLSKLKQIKGKEIENPVKGGSTEFKNLLFMNACKDLYSKKGVKFVIEGLYDQTLNITPEFKSLKLMRYIPKEILIKNETKQ